MNIINDTDLLRDYESAKLVRYDSYGPDSENTYAFDELGEKSVGGLPLVSVRANGRLYITFTPDTHVLVLGSTRSGKTTGYILPTIFIKAHQKRKDSMLITDPKGELYAKSAEMLGRQGYKVVLVNFRDYKHSEFWNPLTQIFRKYRRAAECADRVRVVKTSDKEYRYEFDGRTYLTKAALLLHRPKGRKIAARHRRGTRRDRGAGAEVQDAGAGLAGGRHSARLVHERCGRRPQSAYRPQPAKVHVHPSRKHGHRDHLARIFRQDRPRDRQTALRARRGKRKFHLGKIGEICAK